MLAKEKLSEIAKNATRRMHYGYEIDKTNSNSYEVWIYDGEPASTKLAAIVYVFDSNMKGLFNVNFVPGRNSKDDREVLKLINDQLFDYFDTQLGPKNSVKLLNKEHGYGVLFKKSKMTNDKQKPIPSPIKRNVKIRLTNY